MDILSIIPPSDRDNPWRKNTKAHLFHEVLVEASEQGASLSVNQIMARTNHELDEKGIANMVYGYRHSDSIKKEWRLTRETIAGRAHYMLIRRKDGQETTEPENQRMDETP